MVRFRPGPPSYRKRQPSGWRFSFPGLKIPDSGLFFPPKKLQYATVLENRVAVPAFAPPVQIRPGDRSPTPENIKLARDNKLPFLLIFRHQC